MIKNKLRDSIRNLFLTQQTNAWRDSLFVFLAGRLLFSAWGVVLWGMGMRLPQHMEFYYEIEPMVEGWQGALLGMWQRWDTLHYLRIAIHGYHTEGLTAFYPLYPLLGRWTAALTGWEPTLALLVVSNVAFFFSLVLLHKITARLFSPQLSQPALIAALIFPFSFYNYAAYPQSLLLLCVLLSYWLAVKGHWSGAALVNLLGGLTHSTAALLTILLGWAAVEHIRANRRPLRWAVLAAPFTNFLGIALFLAYRQAAGWPPYPDTLARLYERSVSFPWEAVVVYFNYIIHLPLQIPYLISWIGVALFLVTVGLTVWGWSWMPRPLWWYQSSLVVFLMSNTITGAPMIAFLRYCLIMFPLFIEIARLWQRPRARLLLFFLGVILSLLLSAMFFMWRGDVI